MVHGGQLTEIDDCSTESFACLFSVWTSGDSGVAGLRNAASPSLFIDTAVPPLLYRHCSLSLISRLFTMQMLHLYLSCILVFATGVSHCLHCADNFENSNYSTPY